MAKKPMYVDVRYVAESSQDGKIILSKSMYFPWTPLPLQVYVYLRQGKFSLDGGTYAYRVEVHLFRDNKDHKMHSFILTKGFESAKVEFERYCHVLRDVNHALDMPENLEPIDSYFDGV